MADNLTYAADDISSVFYPRVKATLGPDGTATADWAGRSLGASVGGAAYVDVTQKVVRLSQTPTISAASAYTAGDAVGGLLTFSNAARSSGFPIRVADVTVIDKDSENAALELVLFDRTFTASTDNAVFAPSDADLANCIGVIEIATTDYHTFSTNSAARWPETTANPGLTAVLNGTDLFGQLVTRGTPTYTATSDLIVIVTCVQF